MKLVVYKVNECFLKIDVPEISTNLELKDFFSYHVPGYFFAPKFKSKQWDGKISFYNIRNRTLPFGLLYKLYEFAEKYSYEVELKFNINEFVDLTITKDSLDIFLTDIFKDTKFVPRSDQKEIIFECLKNKRGIVESATGSGKSLVLYSIIRYILHNNSKYNILLIVPSISLIKQMYTDFKQYGWYDIDKFVGVFYGEQKEPNKQILLSTYQSLNNCDKSFFLKYNIVLIDECDFASRILKVICNILEQCVNCSVRLGMTGTLPEDDLNYLSLEGAIGRELFSITSGELIDRGVLSKIKIANILLKYPDMVIQKNKYRPFSEETDTVINYENRNSVFKYIFDNIPDKQNTLILVYRKDHIKIIQNYLEKNLSDKYSLFVMTGDTDSDIREDIRKNTENSINTIILATYGVFSRGVNLKKLHHVILASSYRSRAKVLQSVGRGLRMHPEKDHLVLWDLVDDLRWKKRTGNIGINHLFLQFIQRLEYYKNQGFQYISKTINI